MGRPLVSVLVVAHDAERTLGLALASVAAQTEQDWECIVVDDGSRHSIGETVESRHDRRFRHVRLTENRGRGHARQRALEAATGSLLAMLDADDWMYPSRLERQLEVLRSNPSCALVACSLVVESFDHVVRGVLDAGASRTVSPTRLPVAFASITVRVETARRIGFDERLRRAEDVLFLRRALHEPWSTVPHPLYAYRPSPPTRAAAIEAHRASRLAYTGWEARALRTRRAAFAHGVRELAHTILPEAASRRVTEWARDRALRPATASERVEHAAALAIVRSFERGHHACHGEPPA
jgi:glycosyltransferase involved in cell wall biosynthesis